MTALRAPWKVASIAFLITLGLGASVALVAALATGALERDAVRAGVLYGRAFAPFVIIVTIAAYVIQRARIAHPDR